MDVALRLEGVSKSFVVPSHDRPSTMQELIQRGLRRKRTGERYLVLDDVSLAVDPGRTLGVIGANGAGKTTLLRLIGGVGRPDSGRIEVRGRVGCLLDLGSGLHPDLTGRENVFITGVVAGLRRREVERRFDSIVAFAELEELIDRPLRTYSSGMQMRLAFAVAAHLEPDVLLIDEVLAVGDLDFQKKCFGRLSDFKAAGTTTVLVSHDIEAVCRFCDETAWLDAGRLAAHGNPRDVAEQYVARTESRSRIHNMKGAAPA